MIILKKIFFIIVLFLFSGCYCVKIVQERVGNDNPRWLFGIKTKAISELCFGSGKSNQLNVYYGFPSDSKNILDKTYNVDGISDYKFEDKGQYGIRIEKYIYPGFVPYAVLGVGLDYSFSKTTSSFNSLLTNNDIIDNKLIFNSNRIALSANLYTLVTRFGLLGYTTAQIGTVKHTKIYSGQNLDFHFTDPLTTGVFDYRLGYGFQYFPKSDLGFSIEGGYGRGAYVRAGVILWF
jgi:hypothetical protein